MKSLSLSCDEIIDPRLVVDTRRGSYLVLPATIDSFSHSISWQCRAVIARVL